MTDTPTEGENLTDLIYLLESVGSDRLTTTSDEVFKLLANEQRRHLVFYLIELETATPLSRVAMELMGRIHDRPLTEVTPADQEQMRLQLEHEYLPRLADYGILSWSHGENMIDPLPSLKPKD